MVQTFLAWKKIKPITRILTWLLIVVVFDEYSVRSISGGSVVGSRQPNILVIHSNFKVE